MERDGSEIPITTPEAHRAEAARSSEAARESFERCDTEGALTQWAYQVTAAAELLRAEVAEEGGTWRFPALFDLDGGLVAAKLVEGNWGLNWALLASDDPRSRVVGWVNRSRANRWLDRRARLEKQGYREGHVRAPALVRHSNSWNAAPYVARADRGFSRDAVVVDDGRGPYGCGKCGQPVPLESVTGTFFEPPCCTAKGAVLLTMSELTR